MRILLWSLRDGGLDIKRLLCFILSVHTRNLHKIAYSRHTTTCQIDLGVTEFCQQDLKSLSTCDPLLKLLRPSQYMKPNANNKWEALATKVQYPKPRNWRENEIWSLDSDMWIQGCSLTSTWFLWSAPGEEHSISSKWITNWKVASER